MACHSGIAKDKPAIRRLAQYDEEHQPVPWARVYAVPGFVYWSHRTHSEAGLKCESCHGQVDQMDVVARTTNVTTMGGCVECHRQKEASTGCKACHESQSSRLQFPSGRVLPQFHVEASLEYWLARGFFHESEDGLLSTSSCSNVIGFTWSERSRTIIGPGN
jgi:hypothetical protein